METKDVDNKMNQSELYITLSGMNHHYGMSPLVPGSLVYCEKEPSNQFDQEAIRAILPILGTVAYVANSSYTVVQGTYSAGRIYDKVGTGFYARILFRTDKQVICRIEGDDQDLLQMELTSQMMDLPLSASTAGPASGKGNLAHRKR